MKYIYKVFSKLMDAAGLFILLGGLLLASGHFRTAPVTKERRERRNQTAPVASVHTRRARATA